MRFFLEDSVYVPEPFEAVQAHFDEVGTWFGPFASAAEVEGEALCLRIGPSRRIVREVHVTLGPSRVRGIAVVVPISWRSTSIVGPLPGAGG